MKGSHISHPPPRQGPIRFAVDPADVPAEKAARRLHLTLPQFDACKARLFERGFPRPDPDTGMYDLEAIDRWRKLRNSRLYPELTGDVKAVEAPASKSMGERWREAQERKRNG